MHDAVLLAARAQGKEVDDIDNVAARLHATVNQLQCATCGSALLDELIEDAFGTLAKARHGMAGMHVRPRLGVRWSNDLGACIDLLSEDFDFSVGQRDGICWAWIQPHDTWQPREFEARHDHPQGSGLVVAYTAALAMTAATIVLSTRALLKPM